MLTHISLASLLGVKANSVDPDQTPDNAVFDQGLHCLLAGISFRNRLKMKKVHQTALKLEMDSSNWYGLASPVGLYGLTRTIFLPWVIFTDRLAWTRFEFKVGI